MITIFLAVLFLMQIICFYFLALLYAKVGKFDDLERKQQRLMQEMDDSIAAYLAEIKDENNKLIDKLTIQQEKLEQKSTENVGHTSKINEKPNEEVQSEKPVSMPKTSTFQYATKSYAAVKQQMTDDKSGALNDRERAIQMEAEGNSVEDIAKALGKGKTEIELILKFK